MNQKVNIKKLLPGDLADDCRNTIDTVAFDVD